VVGSGSSTSKRLGMFIYCVCLHPPCKIPPVSDGNNLYQMKEENKELLMENLSQNNLVRNYLAREHVFSAFFFFNIA
jgi:hypothetical protein